MFEWLLFCMGGGCFFWCLIKGIWFLDKMVWCVDVFIEFWDWFDILLWYSNDVSVYLYVD